MTNYVCGSPVAGIDRRLCRRLQTPRRPDGASAEVILVLALNTMRRTNARCGNAR